MQTFRPKSPVPTPRPRSPAPSKTKLPQYENIGPHFEFPTPPARSSPERSTSPIPAPRSYTPIFKIEENIEPHFEFPTPAARGSPERSTSPIPALRGYIGSSEEPVPTPRCRSPALSKTKLPKNENIGLHGFEFPTPTARGSPEHLTSPIPTPRSCIPIFKIDDTSEHRSHVKQKGSKDEIDWFVPVRLTLLYFKIVMIHHVAVHRG